MNLAISATGLRKSYGDKVVLDGIDLHVAEGTIFALLGPNGAGKTTTVQILSTLIARRRRRAARRRPRRGHRPRRGPRRDRCHRPVLRGRQPAHRRGEPAPHGRPAPPRPRARGGARVAELLEQFDLVDAARKPAATYSGGMRRRLDLAMTLVGDPRVIFLDEPTTGLDPRSRHNMWQIIRDLVADGVTIFLTTQYLEEADQLADRIAVLDGGQHRRRGHAGRAEAAGPRRPRPAALRRPGRVRRRGRAPFATVARREALALQVPTTAASRRCAPCSTASTTIGSTSTSSRPHPRPRRRVLRPDRPTDATDRAKEAIR